MRVRFLLLTLALLANRAAAEQAAVNFHLDPMVGLGLDRAKLVTGATLKVDTTLLKVLGPVAPQFEVFGGAASDRTFLDEGSLFGAGLGLRLRVANDELGYAFNPGTSRTGTLWGNAWVDAHAVYAAGGFGPGFDVSLGLELSLLEGLSVGPFAKFMLLGQRKDVDRSTHQLLLFGLSFTIGAPQTTPAQADFDHDGLKGDDDHCVDQPEDHDGFEDADGCPEPDNDHDGLDDGKDQCPNQGEDKDGIADGDGCPESDADADGVLDPTDTCPMEAGPLENHGCKDTDQDHDGVVDRLDACPQAQGVAENQGCADVDTDDDSVVDRLDRCPAEKGAAAHAGCPYPDSDHDGLTDEFDNCTAEPGPASNQGCPASKKQLVVITSDKLMVKDKVYFDAGKATIQARSTALLDQVAAVLKAHTEIGKVRVEGHTDATGDAATNRALSADRARAVVDHLVRNGVATERLEPVGFGPDRPADDNTTPKGRETNRRVEFTIVPR
jgi:outer membrane protein OmpA-like peptidoglycan-associated protein